MNKELSILLIEDDPIAIQEIELCIDTMENGFLVATTNSAMVGLEYVTDFLPNIIILDLEFHLGEGDGLTFLKKLSTLELSVSPFILVTTNNTSSVLHEHARLLGADFILSKHQVDYSAQMVVDFLQMMSPSILNKYSSNLSTASTPDSPAKKDQRIQKRIHTELNHIGISPKAVGYNYLAEAIQLVINDSDKDFSTTIGEKYKKINTSVARAMQNAIEAAWKTSDINDLTKYYTARIHSSKGCPTLTDFIHYYANKIKTDY